MFPTGDSGRLADEDTETAEGDCFWRRNRVVFIKTAGTSFSYMTGYAAAIYRMQSDAKRGVLLRGPLAKHG